MARSDGAVGGLDPALQGALEHTLLPVYLPRQRWFPAKTRTIQTARLVAVTPPGLLHAGLFLSLVETGFEDGGRDTFLLPLSVQNQSAQGDGWEIGTVCTASGTFHLADATGDERFAQALLELIATGQSLPTLAGPYRGIATEAFGSVAGPAWAELPVRHGSAEQSNTTLFLGDRLILKLFRRVAPGVNPDFEIGRFLTDHAQFKRVPTMAGAIEFAAGAGEPATLAILQALVPNQGSGWEHALNGLARFYDSVAGQPVPSLDEVLGALANARGPEPDWLGAVGTAAREAGLLGQRTAELHRALARGESVAEFAPQPIGTADLERLAAAIGGQVERALEALRAGRERLRAEDRRDADRVLDEAPHLLGQLDRLADLSDAGQAIRVHGDFHLGQVLWTGDDYVILDFEGEPAKSLAERRARHSPLKDVVGMLRSYDYAAFASLFASTAGQPGREQELAGWARAWQLGCASSFLRSYLATAAGAAFLPRDLAAIETLLAAYTLDKAIYELQYELNNRPDWVRIPLRGVIALLGAADSARASEDPAA